MHLEIYFPELDTGVRFRVLDPHESEAYADSSLHESSDEYMRKTLEKCILNMKTEVLSALRDMSQESQVRTFEALYNACVMINPGLDIAEWINIAYESTSRLDKIVQVEDKDVNKKKKKFTKQKVKFLDSYLKERVVGQDQAISSLKMALKRSHAGLHDEGRPLGAFIFAGSSGVGKTLLAKQLHTYLFGKKYDMVRIDCAEFAHRHENQKLIGSPAGYERSDEDTYLSKSMLENPNTVVLLDEAEKAHPDFWDMFLKVFDEGSLTDAKGRVIDFRNSIIIMTTNLGNREIIKSAFGKGVGFNKDITVPKRIKNLPKRSEVEDRTLDSIKKHFKPEFMNRLDDIIIFNHLTEEDYKAVAELEMAKVEKKLSKKGFQLKYSDDVLNALIEQGVDTLQGARGMEKVRRTAIEDLIADSIMETQHPKGTLFELIRPDDIFKLETRKPVKARKKAEIKK